MPIDRATAEAALKAGFSAAGWTHRMRIYHGHLQFTRPAISPFLPHRVIGVSVRLPDAELEAGEPEQLSALIAAKIDGAETEQLGLERRINLRHLGLLPRDEQPCPECPE